MASSAYCLGEPPTRVVRVIICTLSISSAYACIRAWWRLVALCPSTAGSTKRGPGSSRMKVGNRQTALTCFAQTVGTAYRIKSSCNSLWAPKMKRVFFTFLLSSIPFVKKSEMTCAIQVVRCYPRHIGLGSFLSLLSRGGCFVWYHLPPFDTQALFLFYRHFKTLPHRQLINNCYPNT